MSQPRRGSQIFPAHPKVHSSSPCSPQGQGFTTHLNAGNEIRPLPSTPFYGRDLWPGKSGDTAPGSLMELQQPPGHSGGLFAAPCKSPGFGLPEEDIALLDLLQAQAKVFPGKGRRKTEPESIFQ